MKGRGNEKKTQQLNHDDGKSTWKINDQKMSAAFYKSRTMMNCKIYKQGQCESL